MKVFGICMVRNEADIIRLTVLHHLSLGLDRVLILDNGSSDGTDEVLREIGKEDERVSWTHDDSAFDQATITTRLAREAHRQGADWILPFDADEFWWAERGDFRQILYASEAGALKVSIVNFIQSREQCPLVPGALLTMTRRVPEPVVPAKSCRELVESQRIAYLEVGYSAKWISRPRAVIEIWRGNHHVRAINGLRKECDEIVCLHAPLRSRRVLESKAEQGRRLDEVGVPGDEAWHVRRWSQLEREGKLDLEWAANSYRDGHLDVYGERRRLVFDPRLRDAVAPLMSASSRRRPAVCRALVEGAKRARSLLRR